MQERNPAREQDADDQDREPHAQPAGPHTDEREPGQARPAPAKPDGPGVAKGADEDEQRFDAG